MSIMSMLLVLSEDCDIHSLTEKAKVNRCLKCNLKRCCIDDKKACMKGYSTRTRLSAHDKRLRYD